MEATGPKPTDLAYVAGYMDGEGCFRANKGNIEVQIKNTYPHVLRFIEDLFGGRVVQVRRKPRACDHRSVFGFSIYGDDARNMVRQLLPYLKEKKNQAELVLELINYPPRSSKKESLIRRLKELKRIDYGKQ